MANALTPTTCMAEPKLDPRVRRTRQLLKGALRDLLRERHLSEITVQDVAERATVNRATFYAHFETKEDLVTTLIEEDLLDLLRKRAPLDQVRGKEALERFVATVITFGGSFFGRCPRMADEFAAVVSRKLQSTIQTLLGHAIEIDEELAQIFPADVRPRAVHAMSWTIYGCTMDWCRAADRPSAEAEAKALVQFFTQPTR